MVTVDFNRYMQAMDNVFDPDYEDIIKPIARWHLPMSGKDSVRFDTISHRYDLHEVGGRVESNRQGVIFTPVSGGLYIARAWEAVKESFCFHIEFVLEEYSDGCILRQEIRQSEKLFFYPNETVPPWRFGLYTKPNGKLNVVFVPETDFDLRADFDSNVSLIKEAVYEVVLDYDHLSRIITFLLYSEGNLLDYQVHQLAGKLRDSNPYILLGACEYPHKRYASGSMQGVMYRLTMWNQSVLGNLMRIMQDYFFDYLNPVKVKSL